MLSTVVVLWKIDSGILFSNSVLIILSIGPKKNVGTMLCFASNFATRTYKSKGHFLSSDPAPGFNPTKTSLLSSLFSAKSKYIFGIGILNLGCRALL